MSYEPPGGTPPPPPPSWQPPPVSAPYPASTYGSGGYAYTPTVSTQATKGVATAVTVEDVSLTANLGSQLNDLLSRMSVDDVLGLMRRKYGNAGGAA